MPEFAPVKRSIELAFKTPDAVPGANEPKRFGASLSALVALDGGKQLLLGGDETVEATPSIEQLVRLSETEYGGHLSRALSDYFALPDETVDNGRVGEVDIEGMDSLDGTVWLTGSHGANRKAPKGESEAKDLQRLAKIERGPNRQLVACIPLEQEGGVLAPAKREGARLNLDLARLLRDDAHLGPFVRPFGPNEDLILPSKDNGLDVEGLAVAQGAGGTRVLLGLRGPVLRGFACVVELVLVPGVEKGQLALALLQNGARYKKHFLGMRGLGVRDLCFDGEDLLVLAGPTMALDGPVALFRWQAPSFATLAGDTLTRMGPRLTRELLLPHGDGDDHPEGMVLLPKTREILVVYDSPAPTRIDGNTVKADVFQLP